MATKKKKQGERSTVHLESVDKAVLDRARELAQERGTDLKALLIEAGQRNIDGRVKWDGSETRWNQLRETNIQIRVSPMLRRAIEGRAKELKVSVERFLYLAVIYQFPEHKEVERPDEVATYRLTVDKMLRAKLKPQIKKLGYPTAVEFWRQALYDIVESNGHRPTPSEEAKEEGVTGD